MDRLSGGGALVTLCVNHGVSSKVTYNILSFIFLSCVQSLNLAMWYVGYASVECKLVPLLNP